MGFLVVLSFSTAIYLFFSSGLCFLWFISFPFSENLWFIRRFIKDKDLLRIKIIKFLIWNLDTIVRLLHLLWKREHLLCFLAETTSCKTENNHWGWKWYLLFFRTCSRITGLISQTVEVYEKFKNPENKNAV